MHTLQYDEITALLQRHKKYLDDMAQDYGEKGYTIEEGKHGILFADWNDMPSHIMHVLEKQYELEWSDEWYICHNNGSKAYRCQPDCWQWLPYYVEMDGEIVGGDEIEEDPTWYIDDVLLNDPRQAKTTAIEFDFTDYGFERVGREDEYYENGWHPGQTDEPAKILAAEQSAHPDEYDYAFEIVGKGQFDINFQLWRRVQGWEPTEAEETANVLT